MANADTAQPVPEPQLQTQPKIQEQTSGSTLNFQEKGKGKSLVYGLTLMLILFAGTTLFLAYQNYLLKQQLKEPTAPHVQSSPEPSPSPELTENWEIYSDPALKHSFKYPQNVTLSDKPFIMESEVLTLSVHKENIYSLDDELPFNRGKLAALEDKELLKNGEFGLDLGIEVKGSRQVVKLNGVYGKTWVNLTGLDICSLYFNRRLFFYKDDYRVEIMLSGPKGKIISENPQYFRTNDYECGEEHMWKDGGQSVDAFYVALVNNQLSSLTNEWYSIFDQILTTFVFSE